MAWGRPNPLLAFWKQMYDRPTQAESALESAIASLGERYRHQHPFWGLKYFADFALLDRKLIIEVDGDSHNNPRQKEKDLLHELAVLDLGWRVLRVSNERALRDPALAMKVVLQGPDVFLGIEPLKTRAVAQLCQLRQSYPYLLAEDAKRSKHRQQSGLKGAQTRQKKRDASKAAGARIPNKRATLAPHPA